MAATSALLHAALGLAVGVECLELKGGHVAPSGASGSECSPSQPALHGRDAAQRFHFDLAGARHALQPSTLGLALFGVRQGCNLRTRALDPQFVPAQQCAELVGLVERLLLRAIHGSGFTLAGQLETTRRELESERSERVRLENQLKALKSLEAQIKGRDEATQ